VNQETSVAEAVLRMVKASGVNTVFGLPGVHNLAFWRCEGPGIPQIMGVRHEQTTVYAADGMARATGGLGVALTTTGPGAANAAGAFGEAAASNSPVLLIASEIPTTTARPGVMRGALHESKDQAAIFEPLAKAVFRPRTAQAAVRETATAIETALAFPRGPVYIDIPMDVLAAPARPVQVTPPARLHPGAAEIAAAAALVEDCADVVIWAGGGVVQSGAEAELVRLAERLRAPVVTTFAARGAIAHAHPLAVGLPAHEPEVATLIGGADLLLAVGTDFDGPDTRNWTMPTARALLNINCSAGEVAKNYRPDVPVVADAALALAALTAAVEPRPAARHDLARLREIVWARILAEPSGPAARGILDAIDTVTARHDATVIADMAIAGYWAGGYGAFRRSRQLHYAVGWGTLGLGLPSAIGPAVLRDKPVLAICGDGGFMFAVGELAVLAQEDLPVTILLVDDGGYGMLRYDQVHAGHPVRGVELARPDFTSLAASFKVDAVELQEGDPALAATLDEALSSGRPRVVVLRARLDPPRTISARWGE
jgi:thiamine pyrophosphate-dependent acetolactate synthase large subunit-like protein